MKTYKKLHESKEVANIHIAKIKSKGGEVKQSVQNGKILLKYSFANEEVDFKSKLLNDIQNFVKENDYEKTITSCDLAKGYCDTISDRLYKYLIKKGYDDKIIMPIDVEMPKFDLSDAHEEWKKYDKKYLVHSILKIGDYYVDLTGIQYSKLQKGIKIYTTSEISKLWTTYKIMKKDEDGKYIGGDYSRAKIRKF